MSEQSPDKNVEAIRSSLLERSKVGFKKYGVTTERTDLELVDWLRHLQGSVPSSSDGLHRTLAA